LTILCLLEPKMYHIKVFLILLSSLWGTLVYSKTVSYTLSIDEKKISFGGASRTGLAINDSIPGPARKVKGTLMFRQTLGRRIT